MKHIKRGYSWLFTRLAAIFGLTIGVQVATVSPSVSSMKCTYTSGYSTVEYDGKKFRYCSGYNGWDWCTSTSNCTITSKTRFYFFFAGCVTSGYYADVEPGTLLTQQSYRVPSSHLTSGICNAKCYAPTTSELVAWGDLDTAKVTAASSVICRPCPPFGSTSANSTGGLVSTCYMSATQSYSDDTGTFSWSSDCFFGD